MQVDGDDVHEFVRGPRCSQGEFKGEQVMMADCLAFERRVRNTFGNGCSVLVVAGGVHMLWVVHTSCVRADVACACWRRGTII